MSAMCRYICVLVIALSLSGCYKQPEQTATSGHLGVCASEAYCPLIENQADVFESLYSMADVSLYGASTRETIVEFINDSLKLIIVDRPFNEEEQAAAEQAKMKYQKIKIAEDAMAVIVNRTSRLQSISMNTVRGVLKGEISSWEQIPESGTNGAVELVCTDRNSGSYELLKNVLFNLEGEIVTGVVVGSQKEVYERVAANPLAMGMVSVACLKGISRGDTTYGGIDSSGPIIALPIAAPDSSGQETIRKINQASIFAGTYPLHYPIYAYLNEKDATLAAGFCSLITGPVGQKIILKFGLVPAAMPVRLVQLSSQER